MSKISEYLQLIKTAIYGREVRDAIHDSIKQCYEDVTTAKTLADESLAKTTEAIKSANDAAANATDKANLANEAALKINNFANDILTDEDIDAAILAAEEE